MKLLNLRNDMSSNIKKLIPQISVLSVKIALFIFLCSIGIAVFYGMEKHTIDITNKYVSINISAAVNEGEGEELLQAIQDIDGVQKKIPGTAISQGIGKLILFNTSSWVIETDKREIEDILHTIDGEVIKGNIPQNPGEVIVSSELIKPLNKNIGDEIGNEDMFAKQYKIAGIYEGKNNLLIGYVEESQYKDNYIIKIEPQKVDVVYDQLEQMEKTVLILSDRDYLVSIVDNLTGLLKIVGSIILIITALDVTVTVSNLNKVYFTERAEEFAIFQAVGYTKKFVLKTLLKEISILLFTGLVCGIILGQSVMILFYFLYCQDKGIPYEMFNQWLIIFPVILVIVIYILSYLPMKKHINRMDWVEVLQQSNS